MPATPERAAFVAQQYRSATWQSQQVKDLYGRVARDTKDDPYESFFDDPNDAQKMLNERALLIGSHARRFRTTIGEVLLESDIDLSEAVPSATIIDDNLVANMTAAIVAVESIDLEEGRTVLNLWGVIGAPPYSVAEGVALAAGTGDADGAGQSVATAEGVGGASGTGSASAAGFDGSAPVISAAAGSAAATGGSAGAGSSVAQVVGSGASTGAVAGDGTNGAAGTDPLWADVVLLIHGQGADGSTAFTDHSPVGRALTANGNVQNDTGQDVHGESILFDGTGDYLSMADAADIRLDSADFCVECYAYLTNLAHNATLLSKVTGGNSGYRIFVTTAGKLTLQFLAAGSSRINVATVNSVPLNQLVHLAVSMEGATGRVFIDGNLEAQANRTSAFVTGVTAIPALGYDIRSAGLGVQGSLNWFRVTYGAARYTAAFTPPTTPLPTS